MMHKITNKHWNVPELRETFQTNAFVPFKRNKNLQEIMGGYTVKNGKVFKTHSQNRKG